MNKFFILLFFPVFSFAQHAGDIVAEFNTIDHGFGAGEGFSNTVTCVAEGQNGQLIVGGEFTLYNGYQHGRIARINADGTHDDTFLQGNGAYGSGSSIVNSIVVQTDGKIIVAGNFSIYDGQYISHIIRLNVDGTFDPGFVTGTGFNGTVNSMCMQSDGKIIVAGLFTSYNGTAKNRILRLNTDGSIDNTFNIGTGFNNEVKKLVPLTDGSLIAIAATTFTYNGSASGRFFQLDNTGAIQPLTNLTTGFNSTISDFIQLPDNNYLVVGSFNTYNGIAVRNTVKLNTDGSINNTFVLDPIITGTVKTAMPLSNGNIILTGNISINGLSVSKLIQIDDSGNLDNTFMNTNTLSTPYNSQPINTTLLKSNGSIVIAGQISIINGVPAGNLRVLDQNGHVDESFNPSTGANRWIKSIKTDNNGKIMVAGEQTLFNGQTVYGLVRLNPEGDIDQGFTTTSGVDGSLDDICVQPDGKILIGGSFNHFGQTSISCIARLNPNGTIDSSFYSGQNIGISGGVYSIVLQPDGKILVSGGFYCSSYSAHSILRLNTDGTIDSSFNVGTGFNNSVNDLYLLPNGQIIATGLFTEYNGSVARKVARLNSDGSIDNTFLQVYDFQYEVDHSTIQPNGKILLGGYGLNSNNPNQHGKLVRLFPNGELDTIWYFDAAQNVFSQADGKILIAGAYEYPQYTNNYGFRRLSDDGTIDTSFHSHTFREATTALGYIECLSLPSEGKVFVGGKFTSIEEQGKNRLAQMYLCSPSSIYQDIEICDFYVTGNGDTLTQNGIYTDSLVTIMGCDSIITINLTIIPSVPTNIENEFSLPSDANTCVGEFAIDFSGNADFELNIDNGAQTATTSGYHLFTNLCPGIHDLQILNACGNTTTTQFVIPVDSNYVFNNPFIDSLAQDSLGTTLEDCDIYYSGIDTAFIDSIWATGNTVNVIWNIMDSNGSNFDTTSYVLNNGNGVYYLQLSVLCTNKSIGDYFTVTESIYFEDGTVSSAGIEELNDWNVQLYPNPTNNLVTISYEGQNAELTIFDAQGKLIRQSGIHSGEQISLREVETGVYFFQLTTVNGRVVKRVVKH